MFLLKALSDVDFLTDSGNWFQSLGAVEENERSNIVVFDLGIDNVPFEDDRSIPKSKQIDTASIIVLLELNIHFICRQFYKGSSNMSFEGTQFLQKIFSRQAII